MNCNLTLGALYRGNGTCDFRVWAAAAKRVELHIFSPRERVHPLGREQEEYYSLTLEDIEPGTQYKYRLDDGREYPDPASRYQPQGVHGPSAVVDPEHEWRDFSWFGLPLTKYVFYEVHTGAFTAEGTFEAIIPYLDYLVDLGVTAIELMPVAQFPGGRNWGYDGAYPFAVQTTYGGPDGLRELVGACHAKGLAIILDVVYNHFGPEGNYVSNFGPYFTDSHQTPWGSAVNFDGAFNGGVRRFFIENAIYWFKEYHFDGLRLDAVHAIMDFSAQPFLGELGLVVHELAEKMNRRLYLFPESDLNDRRLVEVREVEGLGLHAQWCDDFHHSLVALLSSERTGYYSDFGNLAHLAKAFGEGYVYSGQYSNYRRRRHGNSSREVPAERFIVFLQNHDQVGNRMRGERLSELVPFAALKLAAAVVLLSPYLPLLFMGEEYGETARFPYFISHGDPELIAAVRKGRHEEFSEFQWAGEPPDPQGLETFRSAKLNHGLRQEERNSVLFGFYKELLRLRKSVPAFAHLSKDTMAVRAFEPEKVLLVRRWHEHSEIACLYHFSDRIARVTVTLPPGLWQKVLDAGHPRWDGSGSTLAETVECSGRVAVELPAFAAAVYQKAGSAVQSTKVRKSATPDPCWLEIAGGGK